MGPHSVDYCISSHQNEVSASQERKSSVHTSDLPAVLSLSRLSTSNERETVGTAYHGLPSTPRGSPVACQPSNLCITIRTDSRPSPSWSTVPAARLMNRRPAPQYPELGGRARKSRHVSSCTCPSPPSRPFCRGNGDRREPREGDRGLSTLFVAGVSSSVAIYLPCRAGLQR